MDMETEIVELREVDVDGWRIGWKYSPFQLIGEESH